MSKALGGGGRAAGVRVDISRCTYVWCWQQPDGAGVGVAATRSEHVVVAAVSGASVPWFW